MSKSGQAILPESGKTEVLFYTSGGDWWLGTLSPSSMFWNKASNYAGFGNLLRSDVRIWTDNFTGNDQTEVLFYTSGGDWWLGTFSGNLMSWNKASNCAGFGNLLRSDVMIWTDNFSGNSQTDVLFYTSGGDWWLGTFSGNLMSWNKANNCAGFGNLLRSDVRIMTASFNKVGQKDILFHTSTGDIWLGQFSGAYMSWKMIYQYPGYFNLFNDTARILTGDFEGFGLDGFVIQTIYGRKWWYGDTPSTNYINWRQSNNI